MEWARVSDENGYLPDRLVNQLFKQRSGSPTADVQEA